MMVINNKPMLTKIEEAATNINTDSGQHFYERISNLLKQVVPQFNPEPNSVDNYTEDTK